MKDHRIIVGDCLKVVPTLAERRFDLVFVDPPFNIGLEYPDYVDRRRPGEYRNWLQRVFRQLACVLKPTGSLWVQAGQTVQAEIYTTLSQIAGLHWRNTVIWHYTFGPHQRKKFVPSWQALHWFTRDATRFTFNDTAVRVPSYRQLNNDKRADSRGRLPDDVWTISRVCGTFKERVGSHCCQTPQALLERIVLACTNPGDLILDPMCGTGSSGEAAKRLGRRYVGVELSPQTGAIARKRLAAVETENKEIA